MSAADKLLERLAYDLPGIRKQAEEYDPTARIAHLTRVNPHFLRDVCEIAYATLASPPLSAQPAAQPVPEGVLTAIRRVGLTLLKTKDGYELRKFGQIEAHKSQPTADFMAEVRVTCAAALATPGKAVPVSAAVQAEMHKFMRGEPSVFDQMTVAEFQSLATPQAQPSPEVKS